jgi:GAF domain-containing protein
MIDEQRQQRHLKSVDDILDEVRDEMEYDHEQGELYELRALQLLLEVVKSMHSEKDIYALVAMILDSALSFSQADRAFLMLMDENNSLRFKMGRSHNHTYLPEGEFVISSTIVHEAMVGLKPIILCDAQNNEQYSKRQSIQDLELRTIMAAPMRYEGQLLGLIYVDSKRPLMRYSKHHLNVLTSLADQAAVAIYNARKFDTQTG